MDNGFSKDEPPQTTPPGSAAASKASSQELVEIPTVSVEPDRKAEVHRGAEYAVGLLESMGAKAKLYETKGHPIVLRPVRPRRRAFRPSPSTTTSTSSPPTGDDWKTPPFEFVKKGDRYFGRGTTDDKGPAITALFGAKYAVDHGVAANIHFLWELEEEIGSPHFETTIRQNAKEFATDSVVVSDTVWVSRARPAQPAGLRGLQGFRFELQTGQTDQHSGTAGGAARNPVTEICQLISECVDGKTRQGQDPRLLRGRRPSDEEGARGPRELAASRSPASRRTTSTRSCASKMRSRS